MFLFGEEESRGKSVGLLCFANDNDSNVFVIRDAIVSEMRREKPFFVERVYEGEPTKFDSLTRLYLEEDSATVSCFLSKKKPNLLASIIGTKYYLNWKRERAVIEALVKVELESSHDFPCLVIYSYFHTPERLADIVTKVSRELSVPLPDITEEKRLNIDRLLSSNSTVDVKEGKVVIR